MLADFYNVSILESDFAAKFVLNEAHYADTPAALRSYEKLADLGLKNLMNKDLATVNYDQGKKIMAEGKTAHYICLSNTFGRISGNYPDAMDFLSIFPEPSDDPSINGYTTWYPDAWYISKNVKDLGLAKAFLAFMVSQEGIDARATGDQLDGPLLISGLKTPSNALPLVFELQEFINEGKSKPALEYITPNASAPELPQICVEVGMGMVTPEKGAAEYDKAVKILSKQLGLKGW